MNVVVHVYLWKFSYKALLPVYYYKFFVSNVTIIYYKLIFVNKSINISRLYLNSVSARL